MASNITNPQYIGVVGGGGDMNAIETIKKANPEVQTPAFRFVKRNFGAPVAKGYAAGVTAAAYEIGRGYGSIHTIGYCIVQVAPGETIVQDDIICTNALGQAVKGVAGDYELGRSLDNSTGSTVAAPHYIQILLR